MSVDIFEQTMTSWFGITGDYTLIAIAVLIFFLLAFILMGIDIRISLLLCLPLAFALTKYFSEWFAVLFWVITVGLAGYMVWIYISER